ncbi:MAG: prenyltransferase/squalene oxidase repeat-containing protein [Planctomycetota bacterium]
MSDRQDNRLKPALRSPAQLATNARQSLLAARNQDGHWTGELSSSALSTATAICTLELARRHGEPDMERLIDRGLQWLLDHQNADGGFGDTTDSPSNISTTTLCWAVLGLLGEQDERARAAHERTAAWWRKDAGEPAPERIASVISKRYGVDRTFSVPILTMCALCGRFGEGPEAWRPVMSIPFEMAAVPHRLYKWIGLPMVSYALPALIAMGQVKHHHRPSWNPLVRLLRDGMRSKTLRILESIQPASGGFLEAAPLTSFVSMSLIACDLLGHPVVRKALQFLRETVREDGSWPIDTNLATWVTTLSVNALSSVEPLSESLSKEEQGAIRRWLLGQQYREEHPYTHAAPGGWAWTDLSGGVPDADDTPGALLALRKLAGDSVDEEILESAAAGITWLLDLANRDGGIPTFCRGWGKLPFDRSSPDLTAHALRAFVAWRVLLPDALGRRTDAAIERAKQYLVGAQREDGAWVPLWFGNQAEERQENPLYGTSRVVRVGRVNERSAFDAAFDAAIDKGRQWILAAQHISGGWGGAPGLEPTIEETALAIDALADEQASDEERAAIGRGVSWLEERTEGGTRFDAAPIGLYFAKLWYREKLYPQVFTVMAWERARRILQ